VPATLRSSALNTPDRDAFAGRMVPGAPAVDAPLRSADGQPGWLLHLLGDGFTLLLGAGPQSAALADELRAAAADLASLTVLKVLTLGPPGSGAAWIDTDGCVAQRYDLQPGGAVLLRPDQHVCARWRRPDGDALRAALRRALALS
jgi:3-(3-hydroxy-phenyl)propionate hydroxylase